MQNYEQCSTNWIHTFDINLGPGWDASTLMPISSPSTCDGMGQWGFYNTVTSSITGATFGPCFSYDSPNGFIGNIMDGVPGNNYGDNCTNYAWSMCFSVMVAVNCNGQSLSVDVTAIGDGSAGSWINAVCPGIPFNICNATCMNCTLAVSETLLNPTCLNNDGTITVTPTGGIGDYTFNWSPGGQSDSTINGLSAGTYIVFISDSIGCSAADTFELNFTNPVTLTDQVTDASCFDYCDGAAYVFPAGGVAPYSYVWLPTNQTTSFDDALCADTYYVTVTDANFCSQIDTIIISEPPEIILSVIGQDVSCFGVNDGWAIAEATGGSGVFYYSWSPLGQNSDSISNLYAGNYTITATDVAGCFLSSSITIGGPPQIIITPGITNISCFGLSDGAITTIVSQGVPPYQHLWKTTGETTPDISSLTAGEYILEVTDANTCKEVDTFTVTQPDLLTGEFEIHQASCPEGTDGSISILVSGGTSPYNFEWNNDLSLTMGTLSSINSGFFTVEVIDNHGCSFSMSETMTPLPDLIADAGNDVSIELGESTTLTATMDRAGTYYYQWIPGYNLSDSTGQSTEAFPYYTTTYALKGTDVYSGCYDYDSVTVTILPTSYVMVPSGFSPNGDGLNDLLYPILGDLVTLESYRIFNRWGQMVFNDKTTGWDGTSEGKEEEIGAYVYEVTYRIDGHPNDVYAVKGSVLLLR
jgi:gliding motility-associated-like protein